MIHDVVNFIVSMYNSTSVLWLRPRVLKELQYLFKLKNLSHRDARLYILCFCLIFRHRLKRCDLSAVESSRLAIASEPNGFWVNTVEFGKCSDGIVPPGSGQPSSGQCNDRVTCISARSAGLTPGIAGSSKILPSKKLIICQLAKPSCKITVSRGYT
jgi:hypothetical protein